MANDYDEENTFNIYKTGLFVKNIEKNYMFYLRKTTKSQKINARITIMLGITRFYKKLPVYVPEKVKISGF